LNKHLPIQITTDQKQQFARDGVVCLRGLFDENWITLLTAGIELNLLEPGEHSRIWDRTDNNRTVFYDSDNWRRISQYRQFVYESPCVSVATALLDTDSVNFFFDAVFVRSPGVTFATPWHQDEPYWSAEGLDTVSIWMPLVPVSRQSALAFVPGSHLWPNHYRQQDFGELNPDRQPDVDTVHFADDWEPFPDIDADRDAFDVISWEMNSVYIRLPVWIQFSKILLTVMVWP
jgi:ectoine hydroxylase-related dioxygenase (phytanoyl-CoA dioxygenase family)